MKNMVVSTVVALIMLAGPAAANPLHEAAKIGDVATMKELLAAGADPNARAQREITALHVSALRGDAIAIDILIKAGAKVSVETEYEITPLQLAAWAGDLAAVNALIRTGNSENDEYLEESLGFAAEGGHIHVMKALIAAGVHPDTEGWNTETALHKVAKNGQTQAIWALIEEGADPNIKEINGVIGSRMPYWKP